MIVCIVLQTYIEFSWWGECKSVTVTTFSPCVFTDCSGRDTGSEWYQQG